MRFLMPVAVRSPLCIAATASQSSSVHLPRSCRPSSILDHCMAIQPSTAAERNDAVCAGGGGTRCEMCICTCVLGSRPARLASGGFRGRHLITRARRRAGTSRCADADIAAFKRCGHAHIPRAGGNCDALRRHVRHKHERGAEGHVCVGLGPVTSAMAPGQMRARENTSAIAAPPTGHLALVRAAQHVPSELPDLPRRAPAAILRRQSETRPRSSASSTAEPATAATRARMRRRRRQADTKQRGKYRPDNEPQASRRARTRERWRPFGDKWGRSITADNSASAGCRRV